jgi:hypothetical protein
MSRCAGAHERAEAGRDPVDVVAALDGGVERGAVARDRLERPRVEGNLHPAAGDPLHRGRVEPAPRERQRLRQDAHRRS